MAADITAAHALSLALDAVYLKNRPLPVGPTGYYDWQIKVDTSDDSEGHSGLSNALNKVQAFLSKGGFKPKLSHLDAFLDTVRHPHAIDDRKGALPTALGLMAKLDPNSETVKKMNDDVIKVLYETVPHPVASYLGPRDLFREADGGGNNLQDPDFGRAGTPYARSVQCKAGLPRASLPDPGLIFDTILQRKEFRKHQGGMSSLIFAFGTIITHSLFRTDPRNIHINNASSYLDLSPLYGDNQVAQDKVRNKALGRGLLFPDTFSEDRLLFLPPATSALLVLFSRNHNYVAERILKINESKRWTNPPPINPEALARQDEEIFQTAKLINCGHFMNTVMGDYVAGFLGSSEGCNWNMKAFDIIDTKEIQVDRGRGNHVSVEFNLLYRWHATISEKDQKWTEDLFKDIFHDKPVKELSMKDLGYVAKAFANVVSSPAERTFGGLKRGPDGRFADDDLADILHAAIEEPAGSFGGQRTPPVLRLVEIMSIEQSRAWGLCTMNEFRKFLGLKPFTTFEEWNPDPDIANNARRLYGHIDNLEFYTGVQAEAIMPVEDGSRFACGYTMTRAILGDAIAMVRGDRFFTSDFTPSNLTTWGFYDCQRDMQNGGGGGQIPKLLLRHLPRHFPWNSTYSLFSFFTPVHMQETLTRRKLQAKYSFDHPKAQPVPKILNTFTGIRRVFGDPSRFNVVYEKQGYGSVLMFDEIAQHDNDRAMLLHALFPDKNSLEEYAAWFASSITAKIKEKTWKYENVSGNYVDIVRDVINVVCAHASADKLTGIILKTKETPHGMFTENEYFDMLTILYDVTFMVFDAPETSFRLHEAAIDAAIFIAALTAKSVVEVSPSSAPGFLGQVVAHIMSIFGSPKTKSSYPFLSSLTATKRPLDQLVGNILGVAVGACVNYAQAAVNVIDFYLDEARTEERRAIVDLIQKKGPESDILLRGYVCEAMRLKPQFPGLWREAVADTIVEQGHGLPAVEVKAGDRIFASFRNAHLNPTDFPDPLKVNPARPLNSYNLNGAGFHVCPGTNYSQLTIVEILKSVFSLKNVRRAPGNAGKLHGFSEIIHETETDFYLQHNGTVGFWPGSLNIVYDD